ncbi:hypothetical protein FB451DRAFT_1164512 [Mycena latifolia]|nr:hypothetical protein FB451DRAFT_1164512 [Mycena latifolia]
MSVLLLLFSGLCRLGSELSSHTTVTVVLSATAPEIKKSPNLRGRAPLRRSALHDRITIRSPIDTLRLEPSSAQEITRADYDLTYTSLSQSQIGGIPGTWPANLRSWELPWRSRYCVTKPDILPADGSRHPKLIHQASASPIDSCRTKAKVLASAEEALHIPTGAEAPPTVAVVGATPRPFLLREGVGL